MVKGQFNPVALVVVVITFIIYVSFVPTIIAFINDVSPSLDSSTALIVSLFPLMLFLMILLSMFHYGQPQYGYRGG